MRSTLAAVLALLLLAGCGGNTKQKNAYVTAVNRAQTDFVSVVDDTESRISGSASNAETARQLDRIRAAAARVVVRLRGLKPPSGAGTLHANLVHEAQGLVSAFQKAAAAYRSGNPAKILTAKVELSNAVKRVNEQLNATIAALNAKLHS
jgi:hypothetical protein